MANFTQEDYEILLNLLSRFKAVVTTPHILTAVNNLAFLMVEKRYRHHLQAALREIIGLLHEERLAATTIAGRRAFLPFGLTDAAISALSQQSYLVLTEDGPLYAFLSGEGVDVVNFNHLRSYL